jgi:Protein kinase domain
MGVVYLARDERLDRRVALKVIAPNLAADPDFRERFIAEARSAAAIDHPNAVPVYTAGVVDGDLYMAMRYVEGTDLRAELAESGPLSPAAATRIVSEIAAALDAAHAAGMVHRDVKPANILLEGSGPGEGASYLTDFGLTKGGSGSAGPLTSTGQWVGTIDYVAPEQIQSGVVDARTDVYALGCVLYEALTGSVPYPGNDMQKMWGHVNEPFPALQTELPDGGRELAAVIARATAKDPAQRFPSAGDLANAASAAVRGEPAGATEQSVATGAAATGLAQTATAQRLPQGAGGAPTVAARAPLRSREQPTRQLASPRRDRDGASLRTAAILGGAAVIAAGLLAAAVVIAGGDSGAPSTTVAGKRAGDTGPARSRPSEGLGSTDPVLPSSRTECAPNVYVRERVPGTPYTSCPFAREVARAYQTRGEGDSITAYSPVTGEAYEMTCEGVETVRCSDGETAIVYLTSVTASDPSSQEETAAAEASPSSSQSTYSQSLYSVAIPAGWFQETSDKPSGSYMESVWRNPSEPNTSITVDAESPAPPVEPIASAEAVRAQTSQSAGYRELAFESTTLAGLPAARWVFDVSGDRRVDYFLNVCNVGIAMLGSTTPAIFGSLSPTFHEAASSIAVPCE